MEKISENFEDIKILNSSLPKLDNRFERLLKDYIINVYMRSVDARKNCNGVNLIEKIRDVERADRLEHKSFIQNLEKWRSKVYLGWVRQAHIATSAYLMANLLQGDFFAIQGRTTEDRENADKMSRVIKYLFDTNYNFKKVLYQAIIQFVKKGNTVVKGFWQVIETYLHDYEEQFEEVVNPLTGEAEMVSVGFKQVRKDVKTYNDCQLEYVDFEDFQFYPVTGDFKFATKIHRKLMTYDEILKSGNKYINVEKLEKFRKTSNEDDTHEIKIDIKETYITNAFIGEEQISNAIVTLANDEVIIGYKPMPIDYGFSPFLFAPFDTIEGTNLGKGLCFDALPLQYMANFIVNVLIDAQKIGTFSQTCIPDDEDPNKYMIRPASVILYPKKLFEQNVFPKQLRQDLTNLPFTFQSLQVIKNEFEAATIPEFIKGVRPQKDETATRDTLVQQGSETRLGLAAENFNELLLKPLIQLIYTLYRQRAMLDTETRLKIARISIPATVEENIPQFDEFGNPVVDETGKPMTEVIEREKTEEELLSELSDIIPMDKIDVVIDGYKTNISRQRNIQNLREVLTQLVPMASDDIKARINQEGIINDILAGLNIDNKDFLLSEEEAKEKMQKNIETSAMFELLKAKTGMKVQKEIAMTKSDEIMQGVEQIKQNAMQQGIPPEIVLNKLQAEMQPQPPQQQGMMKQNA